MRGSQKKSVYFPPEMMDEIEREMNRQERTLSWLLQQAWRVAGPKLRALPAVDEQLGGRWS